MDAIRSASLDDRLSFRPVAMPDDDAFLRELYFTTRDDLAAIFPEEQLLKQMLELQYAGQTLTYGQQFPNASHNILLLDGVAVGRTMIELRPDMTYFIDFSIMPSARSLGIGTWFLRRTFAEAKERGVPLTFHVEKNNERALSLYVRLGVKIAADEGTHFYMIWDTAN
jgi:ribosomal protein S18 acetylase RimI-like enzyme